MANKKQVPAPQALQYTVKRALATIGWLGEISGEKDKVENLSLKKRILTDSICTYITTLVEKGGSGHSLLKSYTSHKITKEFSELPIVKKCKMNRHNRSAHESKSYGHFVSSKEILDSNLEYWLREISLFLLVNSENKK
jgi:hypothetical protein